MAGRQCPRGLEFDLVNPDWWAVYTFGKTAVVIGERGSIRHSTDGGKTWAAVSSGTNQTLLALHGEGQRLVAVGRSGAILRSEDGGKTWAGVRSGTDQKLVALHGEGQRLVAVGSDIVVGTETGPRYPSSSASTTSPP